MSSSFTQAQLDALLAAKAKGVLTVKYQDKVITYRSIDEIDRIISDMQACLNKENGVETIRQVRTTTRKGWIS